MVVCKLVYSIPFVLKRKSLEDMIIMKETYLWPANLIHCSLVTPYGDRDLGQHLLRSWLVAWWRQAITWADVDVSSVRSSGIHLRAISLEIPQPPFTKVSLKITYLKLTWNLPGANELIWTSMSSCYDSYYYTEIVCWCMHWYGSVLFYCDPGLYAGTLCIGWTADLWQQSWHVLILVSWEVVPAN